MNMLSSENDADSCSNNGQNDSTQVCSNASSYKNMDHNRLTVAAVAAAMMLLIMMIEIEDQYNYRKRTTWVRPLYQMREAFGFYYTNFPLLKKEPEMFHKYIRMSLDQLDFLLELVKPFITKQYVVRKSIPAEERLLLTLRYLASGNDHESLSFCYNNSLSAIQRIVPEVCEALWNCLKPIVLQPACKEDWRNIAMNFERKCYFPHCIGAIDCRHVNIKAPPGSGSQYFDYKHRHSVHLLAITDSNYIFRAVDIGALGRQCDGKVFSRSSFFSLLERNMFNIPPKENLTDEGPLVPYVLLGDSAFSLSHYLLTPLFPKKNIIYDYKIYNLRHTLARRFVENTFGILISQWRILRTTIECQPENVNKII